MTDTGTRRARPWAADRALRLPIATVGLYLAAYIALDWVSFIHPLHGVEVTPWNPPAGLSLALLLARGLAYAPAVLLADLLSTAVVPTVRVPPSVALISSAVVTVGYMGCAAVLRYRLRFDTRLSRSRDMACLIAAGLIAAALVGLGFVASYAWGGMIPWRDYWEAVFQYWIGDAIGIVVFVPMLLLGAARLTRMANGFAEAVKPRWMEMLAQGLLIVATLVVLFGARTEQEPYKSFYLLFLPLIWISVRHGLAGAAWATIGIQGGLFLALELQAQPVEAVRSFQMLMLTLAITGLLLGAAVSERRRALRELGVSESHLATILDTAPDGVITVDAAGRIESVNPAVERQFGLDTQSLIGRSITELVPAPNLLSRIEEQVALPAASTSPVPLVARRNDGITFPVELAAGAVSIDHRRQYTLVIRDVTLREASEAKAREHQAKLARVSRISLAGEMASALAHELNQPLTAIVAYARGCARLLSQTAPDVRLVREGFDHVVQQAERAGIIINRLREFLRDGSRHRTTVEVGALIEEALSLVQAEATLVDVDLRVRLAANLPTVVVDPIQIQQVLLNLVHNAIEAMIAAKSGRRNISIEARALGPGLVEITAADSGPGIPDEIAPRLFDPFVSSKPRGMGLGLSLCRSIIEAHGGQLRAASNPGGGATFSFTLPSSATGPGDDAGSNDLHSG